jgi:Na+/H+-dicarboxylate symporter
MAKVAMTTGTDVLIGLGYYCGVVALGLAVLLVFYMAVVFILGRRNPFTFIAQVRDPLIMAFSTDSSAATMPLSIKTAEEKLKVRPSTAQFVIPIGATVNMAGSALYQGLATMFIAQLYGIDLPIGALLALIVTIIGASIGTPATPGVGIIVLATVLTSAGIPMEGLTLIIGVDRILEMGRTTLNVTGDLVGCVILDRGMDKALPREAEMARQEELEAIREETGEDTLADPAAA